MNLHRGRQSHAVRGDVAPRARVHRRRLGVAPSSLAVPEFLAGGVPGGWHLAPVGLLGWLVHTSPAGSRISVNWPILEQINPFELQQLQPVARWSLGTALSYIGGITLSLVFVWRFTFEIADVLLYAVLAAAAALVFLANMTNTHRLMARAKDREVVRTHKHLAARSGALRQMPADGGTEQMMALINLSLSGAYEKQVRGLPDWPYTDQIRLSLLVSMLVPLAAHVVPPLLLDPPRRLLTP